MSRAVSEREAAAAIARSGGLVALPGAAGEARAFIDVWRAEPDLAAGLTFRGLFVPGLNATDYAALHDSARLQTIFATAETRASFHAGKVDLFPLAYTRAYAWLHDAPKDAAILNVTPGPGDAFSASLNADAAPALLHQAKLRIALVNTQAPRIDDPARTPHFPREAFDLVVETDAPLLTAPPETPSLQTDAVAAAAAALIADGDALQFGIGKLPAAILSRLRNHKNLRIHSGMYVDGVLDLLHGGALDPDAPMLGGTAIGTAALHARIAAEPRARLAPVPHTHGLAALSAVRRLTAINGALQVDLFGQVNSEWIGRRRVSGLGGLPDFLRGAAAAPGGRAIIALPAEQKGQSRIVARLDAPCVTAPASDAQIVVTEHGAADLRGLTVDARAAALIAIAAPAHRADLEAAWAAMRREF
ncbi:MAG: acetyl-CoA hydrolase/transferase C-terminal domain-containing protein [Hyphomonadaceae bacterium]|nr:acetyl-CoA hydrolase/transferase C-terminal domain-containing protein [Hyphomonadaceae bacterium]